MQIIVLANEDLREELLAQGCEKDAKIIWIERFEDFKNYNNADGYIDLLFENEENRVRQLKGLDGVVIINSVIDTLEKIDADFVRINAWSGFMESSLIEASSNKLLHSKTEEIFALFHKKIEWLQDEPGFISARVITMIINEAFIAFEEGVSTREEIDTAMKLGTNYPYGPFEWMDRIGAERVKGLLDKLIINY